MGKQQLENYWELMGTICLTAKSYYVLPKRQDHDEKMKYFPKEAKIQVMSFTAPTPKLLMSYWNRIICFGLAIRAYYVHAEYFLSYLHFLWPNYSKDHQLISPPLVRIIS